MLQFLTLQQEREQSSEWKNKKETLQHIEHVKTIAYERYNKKQRQHNVILFFFFFFFRIELTVLRYNGGKVVTNYVLTVEPCDVNDKIDSS